MNISKNQKLLLATVIGIILSFSSCKKYEDGPGLSFRTKTNRLIGAWELIKADDQKISESGAYTVIKFEEEGYFSMISTYYDYNGQYTAFREVGDWEWENKKEEIEVEGSTFKEDWEILRLTDKELWFEIENGQIWKCEKN